MKIAFIAGILGQGGAERQLFNIIAMLKSEKIDVDLYCFAVGGFWKEPIENLGVEITYISGRTRLERLLSLITHLSQGQYDYIHSQHFYTNLYAVFAAWFCGAQSIGSVRSDVITEVEGMGIMGYPSLLWPLRLAANSKDGIQNAIMYSRKPETIFFLPNFVDPQVFYPGFAKNKKEFRIIVVGTIWKPKRIDRVIDVAELISKRSKSKKSIVFHVFGDGDMIDSAINYAKSKGILNSNIYFRGRTKDIALEYRLADTLLLTSDYEGTPNVVLEAMASGLPVVSTSVGDVKYIISHGETGYLVNLHGNVVEEMAGHIEYLANSPHSCEKMGEFARLFIAENYSLKNLREALFSLYISRQITNGR